MEPRFQIPGEEVKNVIASMLALVVLAFLVVYSVARSRVTKEAQRRSDARKVRNRPQSSRRAKERVPVGRRSNILVVFLLILVA